MRPGSATGDVLLSALLIALIFTGFMSGITADVGPVTINLSYLLTMALLGYLSAYALLTSVRVPILFRDDVSLLLYLFVLSNIVSSLALANDRFVALKGCGPLILGVLTFSMVRAGIRTIDDPLRSLSRYTVMNTVMVTFGLLCMLSALRTGTDNIGATFGHLSVGTGLGGFVPPSIRSLSAEPNLFAIGTAMIFCLPLGRYLVGDKVSIGWMMLIPAAAILFAYTRSVYVALVITIAFLMIVCGRIRVVLRVGVIGFVVLSMMTVLVAALPNESAMKKALVDRAENLVNLTGGTGEGRLLGYQAAWKSYVKHPIVGNGTLTADTRVYNSYTGDFQDRMGTRGWLTGSGIQALHDTGLIGLAILLALFTALIHSNYRTFRSLAPGHELRGWALGFLGGNIVLLITSQLSSPLWTPFPYIYWALNMEFLRAAKLSIRLTP